MDAIAARTALARLARIDDATRLYRLDLASDAPLLVERWQGEERLSDGFEWQGRPYKSLSAIARAITGTRWNGWTFFGLKNHRGRT